MSQEELACRAHVKQADSIFHQNEFAQGDQDFEDLLQRFLEGREGERALATGIPHSNLSYLKFSYYYNIIFKIIEINFILIKFIINFNI